MELALVIVLVAGLALIGRLAALLLGLLAWVGLGLVAMSLLVGVPVPLGAVVVTVACWVLSQAASRIRHGEWRSWTLRNVAAR